TANSPLYNAHLLSTSGVILSQVLLTALGGGAAIYVTHRILSRDMRHLTARPALVSALVIGFVVVATVSVAGLYLAMGGAQ
ncbi:MAG: hypothetical protein ACYCO4_08720, partial [Sulfobacillus sp.]